MAAADHDPDVPGDPTPPTIDWIDDRPAIVGRDDHSVATSSSLVTVVLIAAVAVTLVVALMAAERPSPAEPAAGDDAPPMEDATPDVGDDPATSPAGITVDADVPPITIVDPSRPVDLDDAATAALREIADADLALAAVVTSPVAGDAHLVRADGNGHMSVTGLPELSNWRFDRSGDWLAATTIVRQGELTDALFVGAASGPDLGEIEPVAVGVRGHAWHSDRPGNIAWLDGTTITTNRFVREGVNRQVEIEVDGRLQGWGDWGFAVLTSFRSLATSIVAPDGATVVVDVPGRYHGVLPDGTVLLSGGEGGPVRVDPATGETAPVPWLGPDEYVWTMRATDDGVIALVGRDGPGGSPFVGSVLVIHPDASVTALADLDSFSDVGWAADGTLVTVDQQQPGDASDPGRFLVRRPERIDSTLPVPDLFSGREWVAALHLD